MNSLSHSATGNAVQQARDELERFAYIVSHDLQQEVRNISNYTGLIAKHQGPANDEDFKFFLSVLTESSAKLNEQLAALLTYSRIGRNTAMEAVDCNLIVEDILAAMQDKINEKQAEISVGPLPVVTGNQEELKLVFENLIGNALKFTSKDRTPIINIECLNKTQFWEFSIKDNGIGLKEKYFQRIFQIFQTLNAADDYPGTGIGLAFAKKVIESYNGTIWVSANQGNGAIFYFTFPIIK